MDESQSTSSVNWRRNGIPRRLDLSSLVVGVLGGVVIVTVMVLVRPGTNILLQAFFLALFVTAVGLGHYGHWRRRPASVGFSGSGVHVQYRTGVVRLFPWERIQSVRLGRSLGDIHASIRYVDGRVEDRAHIYGDAALELKRRFDEWKTSSTG